MTTTIPAIRGDTLGPVIFRIKDQANVAIDLTGSVVTMKIKLSTGTSTLSSAVPNDGLDITDAPNGEVTFTYTAAQTQSLLDGQLSPFRLIRAVGAETHTLVQGAFDTAVPVP